MHACKGNAWPGCAPGSSDQRCCSAGTASLMRSAFWWCMGCCTCSALTTRPGLLMLQPWPKPRRQCSGISSGRCASLSKPHGRYKTHCRGWLLSDKTAGLKDWSALLCIFHRPAHLWILAIVGSQPAAGFEDGQASVCIPGEQSVWSAQCPMPAQGTGLIAASEGSATQVEPDHSSQQRPALTDLASTSQAHWASQWSSPPAHRISSVMPAAPAAGCTPSALMCRAAWLLLCLPACAPRWPQAWYQALGIMPGLLDQQVVAWLIVGTCLAA